VPGPILNGERVRLRPLAESDLPRLLEILREQGVSEWWPDYDMVRLRADTFEAADATSLAVDLEGPLIGLIMYTQEAEPHYRSASIDIALDVGCTGQGLGTDALRTLSRHLLGSLGHHRLTVDPACANGRAIRAYRKVGFSPVGVMREYELGADGTWHDNLLMDMLAGELR